ncbi:MAG: hypothetical protein HYS20_13680 [Rhodocyclales bacterium]|nr:hypothetical protein [Rhodocyclales bacterium]
MVDHGLRVPAGQAAPAVIAAPPSIDLDQARRIVRDMGDKHAGSPWQRESPDAELARRLQADRPPPGETASRVNPRNPSPEAIFARGLQRAPTGETRMSDGTVVIRFSAGVCVVVPPHRPSWQGFDDVLVVPGTCPGSLGH